jgi:hypothetical protein
MSTAHLPSDLLPDILAHADPAASVAAASACGHWRQAVRSSDSLWRVHCRARWSWWPDDGVLECTSTPGRSVGTPSALYQLFTSRVRQQQQCRQLLGEMMAAEEEPQLPRMRDMPSGRIPPPPSPELLSLADDPCVQWFLEQASRDCGSPHRASCSKMVLERTLQAQLVARWRALLRDHAGHPSAVGGASVGVAVPVPTPAPAPALRQRQEWSGCSRLERGALLVQRAFTPASAALSKEQSIEAQMATLADMASARAGGAQAAPMDVLRAACYVLFKDPDGPNLRGDMENYYGEAAISNRVLTNRYR